MSHLKCRGRCYIQNIYKFDLCFSYYIIKNDLLKKYIKSAWHRAAQQEEKVKKVVFIEDIDNSGLIFSLLCGLFIGSGLYIKFTMFKCLCFGLAACLGLLAIASFIQFGAESIAIKLNEILKSNEEQSSKDENNPSRKAA